MVATELMKLHQQDARKFFLTTTTTAGSRKITSEKDINALHNPSFRVYYGGSSVAAVPFTWESAPGTPKNKFFPSDDDDNYSNLIPPLTPPPSFYSSAAACAANYSHYSSSGAKNILGSLLASSSSSSSTSSSGGDADVYNSRRRQKKKKPHLISRWFSCSIRRLTVADWSQSSAGSLLGVYGGSVYQLLGNFRYQWGSRIRSVAVE